MNKKLEILVAKMKEAGWEAEYLNYYAVRVSRKGKYLFDAWAPRHKKHLNFLGYTIHVWDTDKYCKEIFDLDEFIIKYK